MANAMRESEKVSNLTHLLGGNATAAPFGMPSRHPGMPPSMATPFMPPFMPYNGPSTNTADRAYLKLLCKEKLDEETGALRKARFISSCVAATAVAMSAEADTPDPHPIEPKRDAPEASKDKSEADAKRQRTDSLEQSVAAPALDAMHERLITLAAARRNERIWQGPEPESLDDDIFDMSRAPGEAKPESLDDNRFDVRNEVRHDVFDVRSNRFITASIRGGPLMEAPLRPVGHRSPIYDAPTSNSNQTVMPSAFVNLGAMSMAAFTDELLDSVASATPPRLDAACAIEGETPTSNATSRGGGRRDTA